MKKLLTLCIIYQDSKVLLGMKKRGFGEGRWNGFGGKLSAGESIEEATVREVHEEVGLELLEDNLEKRGVLDFHFENQEEVLEVHIFSTTTFTGTPVETEEMCPQWFTYDSIPYADMWPDDIFWLPELLQGKNFTGSFHFGKNDIVLKNTFRIVNEKVL